jgi:DNA topoisomerase-3
MKEICVGAKTKNDVVHESVEQYREVFIKASQQIDVLKSVSHPFYGLERKSH